MTRDLAPTQRFSSRVENYVRYRPGYPPELIGMLERECGLDGDSIVADIGSGTGLLTQLFLAAGCCVYAVEPNREMRLAGERLLSGYPRLRSIDASAEATTLPDASADLIVAGQAFHWFDRARARAEFARVLRPGGWVALVWNERSTDATPFLADYERLLHSYAINYAQVTHKQIDTSVFDAFFAPGRWQARTFANRQLFDFAGLQGRLLSSSYTPEPGHAAYAPMIAALQQLFETYQHDGRVSFEYDTTIYYGRLA